MKKKRMVYTILFCVWIGLNYVGLIGYYLPEMEEYLAIYRDPPQYLSEFQMWFFNIMGIIFDSIFIAIATGIFAYHYRELKTWQYIALALFIRYLLLIIIFPFILWGVFMTDFFSAYPEDYPPLWQIIITGSIQLILTIAAAFVGISYGQDAEYLDEKDKSLGYIGGVSKLLWALLILPFNPVARFVAKLSISILYKFTRDVTSKQYWSDTWSNLLWGDENSPGGIINLILNFFFVALFWIMAFGLFYYGIQTIRQKEANHRLLKILAIYVVLPAAIVVIPIIRNRTWFF